MAIFGLWNFFRFYPYVTKEKKDLSLFSLYIFNNLHLQRLQFM